MSDGATAGNGARVVSPPRDAKLRPGALPAPNGVSRRSASPPREGDDGVELPPLKRRRHQGDYSEVDPPPADEGYDPEVGSGGVGGGRAPEEEDAATAGAYSPTAPAAAAAGEGEYEGDRAYRLGEAAGTGESGNAVGNGSGSTGGVQGGMAHLPPNANHGPQQAHGNAVLVPQVAEVLNGLFARGFFRDSDIDARAIDFLASVSPELALAALEDIQHRDFSAVRNMPAFIFSIFKTVVQSGGSSVPPQPPPGGFEPAVVPENALSHLPKEVANALQAVFGSGVCHPSQFDDRAMDILVELHPVDAVRALTEFAAMERGRVRNPSAFWMGLARKYKNQSANGGGGAGGPLGPPMGMSGPPPMGGPMGNVPMTGPGHGPPLGGHGPTIMPYGGPPPVMSGPGAPYHVGGGAGSGGTAGFSALDHRLEELANMGVLRPDLLDDRAADALRKLPERDALSVLAELPEPSRVRNMSAYVMGLCKKFATGEARSLTGGGRNGGGGFGPGGGGNVRDVQEALSRMNPDVRNRFYAMVDRGMFPETAFDHRAITALQGLNVNEACAALDELANSDPRRIHNISAYWMGLAKKFGAKAM